MLRELRIKFTRSEDVKYISHLDVMKVFERAVRRGGIEISYSKGFNPHPQIIFGLPMGVGLSSVSEYADIGLEVELAPEDFIERINRFLPDGFGVVEAKVKTAKGNIMSQIEAAGYEVTVNLKNKEGKHVSEEEFNKKIADFLSKESIMVIKENKSGKKNIDIKNLIFELKTNFFSQEESYVFNMLLGAGQTGNVKPELVVTAFNEFSGFDTKVISTVRTALYTHITGKIASPMDDRILLQPR